MKKNIYLFITILSFIGLISGYNFYKVSDKEIINNINIEETISKRPKIINNVLEPITIITYSILIIPTIINVIKLFYKPFTIGYLIGLLNNKVSINYIILFHIIPYIFQIILISIGIRITINLIKKIFIKNKSIKRLLKKYILITIIYYIYIIIIYIFSINIIPYLYHL